MYYLTGTIQVSMKVREYVFFFKQKTAYEMRISDWSSDVCSSDLLIEASPQRRRGRRHGYGCDAPGGGPPGPPGPPCICICCICCIIARTSAALRKSISSTSK